RRGAGDQGTIRRQLGLPRNRSRPFESSRRRAVRAEGPGRPGLAQGRGAAGEVPGRAPRRRREDLPIRARPSLDGRSLRPRGEILMKKAWIVARHEFLVTVRRVWFVVATFILPLVFAGIGYGMSSVAKNAVNDSLAPVRSKPL